MATKKTTPVSKKKDKPGSRPRVPKRDYRTQLVVQFSDGINLPYSKEVAKSIKEYNVGPWEQLEKKFPGLTITPLFSSVKPEVLQRLIRKAKDMDPTYKEGRFFQSFRVTCPVESKSEAILEELSSWKNIRTAKIASNYSHPAVTYSDEARAVNQTYLNEAELSGVGIGAKTVWDSATVLGSDGAGIKLIDIEKGWTLNHQDLGLSSANLLGGIINDAARADGTSVLGIIKASDNTENCIGIAPASTVNAIAYSDTPSVSEYSLEDAIVLSLTYLGFGDVLLVEAQKTLSIPGNDYNGCHVPVEIVEEVFDAIRLATALGIVVVEPGGDGDNSSVFVNLDDLQISGHNYFLSTDPQYRNSGAIFVTAAHSAVSAVSAVNTHEIMPWAPKGERIDCYAWGENISTLSSDSSGATDQYTDTYGGTSGAAAIIAGAILNMQSMAVANQGYRFSPLQIKNILRNAAYGTPLSHDPGLGTLEQLPVYMPDLYAYATSCINSLPDIFMRDYVGDNGDAHAGEMSWSPDVIIQNSSVADPQGTFGDFSADYRAVNAITGRNNYIYCRALNRGGVTATGASVTVFWSNPSTLITPSSLNLIGTVNFPDIGTDLSAIPVRSDVLTVSNELIWNVTQAAGHYCFVAVITCLQDPYMDPKSIVDDHWSWEKYYAFIRNNNNVTWKNFDVVEMSGKSSSSPAPDEVPAPDPDPVQEEDPIQETEPETTTDPVEDLPKKGWLGLDFISPGLPGKDQKMSLEVLSQLPKGVKILLQIPLNWKRTVYKGSPYVLHNKKKRVGFAPINPRGKSLLEDIMFKADSKTHLKLFIYVPDKLKTKKYIIAIRQMLEGKEVGRYTWELVPPKDKKRPDIAKPIKKK